MSDDIKTKVRKFLSESFDASVVAGIDDDVSLMKAGILDSAAILTLVTFLETDFSIRIGDDDMSPDNLDSVAQIAAFVERKTAA